MGPGVSRRGFLRLSAGAARRRGGGAAAAPRGDGAGASSVVSLVRGEDRRKNVAEALALVEDQILPVLRQKKYVVVKPNLVSLDPAARHHATPTPSTASSTSSRPRFKGPVVIAESSAGEHLRAATSSSATRRCPPSTGSARSASWT